MVSFYKLRENMGADAYYKVLGYHVLLWFKIKYLKSNRAVLQSHYQENTEFLANFVGFRLADL